MLLRVYSLMAREMVSFVEIVYGKDGVYTNDSVGSDVSVCKGIYRKHLLCAYPCLSLDTPCFVLMSPLTLSLSLSLSLTTHHTTHTHHTPLSKH